MLLINLCVCHYRQTCHPWKRTFTLRLRAYPCWRQRTLANGGHFIFILFCGCGCYSVDFSFVVHQVDNSLWFVLFKRQQKNNYNLSEHFFPYPRKENNNVFVDDLKEGEKRPVPNPCRTFLETYESYPEIMENIERVGFVKPTPIQVRVKTCRRQLGRVIQVTHLYLFYSIK